MRWFPITSGHGIQAILFAGLCGLLSPAASAEPCNAQNQPPGCTPKPGDKGGAQPPAEPKQPAVASDHIVKGVYSVNTYRFCRAHEWQRGTTADASECKHSLQGAQLALTGAGDIVVALDAAAYQASVAYAAKSGAKRYVYFNGVELTDETQVRKEDAFGGYVFERIHLQPKEKSKLLWSGIIREAGITGTVPLRVGFGWQANGATSTTQYSSAQEPRVAVSDDAQLMGAIAAVVVLIAFALAVAVYTDILRDRYPAELASVVAEARLLRERLEHRAVKDRTALLTAVYPAYRRGPRGYDVICRDAADTALRDPVNAVASPAMTIGLAESDISYSLTRIQLFAWFLFAIAAGIYFWFLLGELPPIDNSVLALLGISSGIAGVSWAVDASDKTAVKQPNAGLSRSLLSDMIRSAEDKDQVHRFQAVIVNVLLLAIGCVHVVRSITYPTFDQSWLIFLTISGATFALGKQMNEKK
ncbi:hypothetical protein [Pseudoduganella chitinolytica]|uniref:Uncharacterized protein n=1 Tax=Pseudoduganella chitinolytica TaxID=34070 RepID=A0ABY8BF33_9BURK|nr:hypothetical protein [Pseudoduganella chitinolytica]WEF34013.1 hypothetical protein PX653_04355 [Pseudoduganella chitinolytica]